MKMVISSKIIKTAGSLVLTLLMLGFAIDFLLHEGINISQVGRALGKVPPYWLYLGLGLSATYVWIHGQMYRASFRALGLRVSTKNMVRLFLKRNLVSVFLPAGFLSSQAFFSKEIERLEKVNEHQVLAASGIFAIAGLLSMLLLGLPVLGWLFTQHVLPNGAVEAFLVVTLLFVGVLGAGLSLIRRGFVFQWCQKYLPALAHQFEAFDWTGFELRFFIQAILWSSLVEVVGILHVFIAVRALGAEASFPMALAGYTAVLVVLLTSPFLRGVGAVEALLSVVLIHFGVPAVAAVSAAVLFRFFEFWTVLAMAIPVFLFRPGNLLVRLAPAILLFSLGTVSILSGLTPAVPERINLLRDYLPLQAIHASMAFTVSFGLLLLVTAFYLFRGLRSAWWLALGLSVVSLISHLLKGFDYEEAILALTTIGVLLYQHKEYKVRNDLSWMRRRWFPVLAVVATILLLTTLGFYFLDHRHFGADFSWTQSLYYTLESFLSLNVPNLHPQTIFGADFLAMVHLLGGLTLLLLMYTFFQPFLPHFENTDTARLKALELVRLYGNSPLDYFKTYADKQYYFSPNEQSFIAYKTTARYALVLENPVAINESAMENSILDFDRFCRRNGLSSIYYRIPAQSAPLYRSMGKSLLPLGQEASVNLQIFSLEGKEYKSMRNAVNKMEREGFTFVAYEAPLNKKLLQQLRAVSDEWLRMYGRNELGFSQGIFDDNELKHQSILTMEDSEGKIFAFINLIPGASGLDASFDLMRRTQDAPNGTMDFMFVKMFLHLKLRGYQTCNLGLVPMSGLDHPITIPERLIHLAYERLPQFSNYKSLRFFKEKFNPEWEMKYVAYDSQLDLVNLPGALNKVVRA